MRRWALAWVELIRATAGELMPSDGAAASPPMALPPLLMPSITPPMPPPKVPPPDISRSDSLAMHSSASLPGTATAYTKPR